MQERIFEILFNKDEITWQSLIYDLVREEKMDPWDVDVSILAQRFVGLLKKLKEMDFRISGKILLAAAILLRLKSNKLVGKDLDHLDKLMAGTENLEEDFYEELENQIISGIDPTTKQEYSLIPRTPQPRKRKVSVFDLVKALEKALEVNQRRVSRIIPPAPNVSIPTKGRDISIIIRNVYHQIIAHFQKNEHLTFKELMPSESKEDKVYTFIPLLHLDNQRKIELTQQEHFGDIDIQLLKVDG